MEGGGAEGRSGRRKRKEERKKERKKERNDERNKELRLSTCHSPHLRKEEDRG